MPRADEDAARDEGASGNDEAERDDAGTEPESGAPDDAASTEPASIDASSSELAPIEVSFALSDEEFRRAWLREHYAQASPARNVVGPVMVVLSAWVLARHGASFLPLVAGGYGLFLIARPFLLLTQLLRERKKQGPVTLALRVDETGITIRRGAKTIELAWSRITAAGRRDDYVWYEIGRSQRATIPLRVVEDREALEALFRAHVPWRGRQR